MLLFNLSSTAQADDVFRNFTENRFDSGLSVNYFKSEANFASNGSQQGLASGYSFQIIDTLVSARYVLLEGLGLHAGMNIGSSEAADTIATRRNSALSGISVGADYLFYRSRDFSIYADLTYKHAVETIAIDTDSALNNDGASEVHAAVTALFDLRYMQPYLSGGVNYRMEGLSTLLTYQLGVQTSVGSLIFGAALNGFVSVLDDSKTNTPAERELVTNRVNATSKKFYAINPNLLDSDLYMQYKLTPDLMFQVRGGYTIMGSNAAVGYHFGGGVTWGFGGDHYENYSKPSTKNPPRVLPAPAPVKAITPSRPQQPAQSPNKKFQEDISDGVNQDYFKPVQPSQDPYYDKVQDVPPAEEDEGDDFQVNSKKVAPGSGGTDNEYKIKLKRAKKRK